MRCARIAMCCAWITPAIDAFLSHRSSAVLMHWHTQRELERLAFAWAGSRVREWTGWTRVTVRVIGFDDEIYPFLEFVSSDLASGEFENATCAFGCNSDAPRSHVFGEAEDAHLAIQEHDVDGKAHAERMNAAAGNQQQSFALGHGAATEQPEAARLKGARQVNLMCDTSTGRGA